MKTLCAIVAIGLMASMGSASAQRYGGPDYGYDDGYQYERRPRYREPYYGYREPGPPYRGRAYAFHEGEYLRCNRDVLRAVRRGETESGWAHYLRFGRYEGRRLSC
jgi:hypothetical protein